MNFFLSTTGQGLARAVPNPEGAWAVETILAGHEIFCLAADPLQAGVLYAGTRGQGLLRSDDFGKTWAQAGLSGHTVKSVSASPLQPGVVYAGTRPARLHVSHDQGQHWQELASFHKIFSRRFWFSPADAPFTAYVQGIALSPTDPNLIVAGIEFGAVVRSRDGGKTWQDHRPGALRDCHSISFHVSDGKWLVEAGGTGAGVATSQDAGSTWQQPRLGLDRHYGWACASDPGRPEVCYASISPSPNKAHKEGQADAFIFRSDGSGLFARFFIFTPPAITAAGGVTLAVNRQDNPQKHDARAALCFFI
jgi:hypothetical protein